MFFIWLCLVIPVLLLEICIILLRRWLTREVISHTHVILYFTQVVLYEPNTEELKLEKNQRKEQIMEEC